MHLKRRLKKGKEDPKRILERKGLSSISRPNGEVIWIHAASVGEALSSIPVIECLLKNANNITVLLTTGTVTSAKLMNERLPERAYHQYVPLDKSTWVQDFIDFWKPSVVIWLESEFWPNTLCIVKKNSIPLCLLNGRISQRSYNRWQKAPWIIKGMLSCFDICLAQAKEDASYLSDLGAKNVLCLGNIKLGAPPLPVDDDQLSLFFEILGDRPRWLFASSHDGEEIIAADIHSAISQTKTNLLTIIVPRHPERGSDIANKLRSKGFKCKLRSNGHVPDKDTDIYIADTMGELGLFFRLCEIVFMGKSLIYPGGGQNPYEAAKLNSVVLFGPYMSNFVELSNSMIEANAAYQVRNIEELNEKITELLSSPEKRQFHIENTSIFCKKSEAIIENSVERILNIIK